MGCKVSFGQKVKDFLAIQRFMAVYNFLMRNGLMPGADAMAVMDMLAHLFERGWIYYGYENDELVMCIGAFRVKSMEGIDAFTLPEKEEGDILFVEFAVSIAEDKHLMRRMLQKYTEENDVKKMIFYKHNPDGDDKYTEMPIQKPKEQPEEVKA